MTQAGLKVKDKGYPGLRWKIMDLLCLRVGMCIWLESRKRPEAFFLVLDNKKELKGQCWSWLVVGKQMLTVNM